MNRVLGVLEGIEPGPLNILLGGVHGNESAGIKAIIEVFQTIKAHKIPVRGTLVGLAGNLQAISKNKRYIDYDLNRCWTQDVIDKVYRKDRSLAEDIELHALHETILHYKNQAEGQVKIIMDLHATSSARGNFVVIPENEAGHPIIRSLKQPVVIDLDKYLQGTLLKYFRDQGFIAFAFEGGMIGSREAVDLHVAGIWELLQAAGNIDSRSEDSFLTYRKVLESIPTSYRTLLKSCIITVSTRKTNLP